MLRISKFSNKSKALPVIGLMVSALALGACSKEQAQEGEKGRPVLVATVHYQAQSPERSFVGTVRPRIETDMGFRVPGKVAKRLVEVGQMVDVGQPLATLDEVDLKLQAEQAEAELSAAKGVLSQATAAEGRAKELRTKGWSTEAQLDQVKAAADEARARLNRAERSVELTKNSLLCQPCRRCPRRRHRNADRAGTGCFGGADRRARGALR
jgi:multidrug efflux pump subunit AcrA (membrane-fusion protein)